jgi:hypothetical protein
MPRYFFHIHEGEQRILIDTVGMEVDGIRAMREEAIECARFAYGAGLLSTSKQNANCRIEVTDACGKSSLTMRIWPSMQFALLKIA